MTPARISGVSMLPPQSPGVSDDRDWYASALFAQGALKAALWARGRKPGLYAMADVLGLRGL